MCVCVCVCFGSIDLNVRGLLLTRASYALPKHRRHLCRRRGSVVVFMRHEHTLIFSICILHPEENWWAFAPRRIDVVFLVACRRACAMHVTRMSTCFVCRWWRAICRICRVRPTNTHTDARTRCGSRVDTRVRNL